MQYNFSENLQVRKLLQDRTITQRVCGFLTYYKPARDGDILTNLQNMKTFLSKNLQKSVRLSEDGKVQLALTKNGFVSMTVQFKEKTLELTEAETLEIIQEIAKKYFALEEKQHRIQNYFLDDDLHSESSLPVDATEEASSHLKSEMKEMKDRFEQKSKKDEQTISRLSETLKKSEEEIAALKLKNNADPSDFLKKQQTKMAKHFIKIDTFFRRVESIVNSEKKEQWWDNFRDVRKSLFSLRDIILQNGCLTSCGTLEIVSHYPGSGWFITIQEVAFCKGKSNGCSSNGSVEGGENHYSWSPQIDKCQTLLHSGRISHDGGIACVSYEKGKAGYEKHYDYNPVGYIFKGCTSNGVTSTDLLYYRIEKVSMTDDTSFFINGSEFRCE